MTERVISIDQARAMLPRPWMHTVVGQVDDYCAYLCRFEGVYRFHQHDRDEMYLVLEGEAYIEYGDGMRHDLKEGDTLVVKAGNVHRSGADEEALVLMFKARDLFSE
jgi:mannose-6-phosphate isomerase-like protein (cupin superfamily)